MSQTQTASATYTFVDIGNVVRRVAADLFMIADSTGVWTATEATNYTHDVEFLAKAGYLKYVDVTLTSYGIEVKATRYDVNTDSGSIKASRPGGVLWPRVAGAHLRVVLGYTAEYTSAEQDAMKSKLKIGWIPTTIDTSHASLMSTGGRNYTSSSYGMQRKDWAA